MSDLDILHQLIKQDAQELLQDDYGKSKAVLQELSPPGYQPSVRAFFRRFLKLG
jgi:hypothetical protein